MDKQSAIEYAQRQATDAARIAYHSGWSDGYASAKDDFGKMRGKTTVHRASDEDREKWGDEELAGWCECGKPISARWAEFINFCPWCGKIIDWKDSKIGGNECNE